MNTIPKRPEADIVVRRCWRPIRWLPRGAPECGRWSNVTAFGGWSQDAVAKMTMPVLMVSGQFDRSVPQDRVRDLYNDLPGHNKVFVDVACSSHYAMWERNHLLLFQASLEWLNGLGHGGRETGRNDQRLGYSATQAG